VTAAVRITRSPALLAAAAAAWSAVAMLLAYRAGPLVPVAAAGGLTATGLAYARPLALVHLAVALIPLELFAVRLGSVGITVTEALFALAGLGWGLRRIVDGHRPWVSHPLNGGLGLLLLAVLAGTVVAIEPFTVVRILVMWTLFALVLQLVVDQGTPAGIRRILWLLTLSAAVVAAVAVVSSGGQAPQLSDLGDTATGRAVGSFTDPNILGTFLALALPGALVLGLTGSAARRPVALAAFGLILAGLGLSLSRGGLLAAAGALLCLFAWRPVRRVAIFATGVVIVLILANANPLAGVQQVDTVVERVVSVRYAGAGDYDQRAEIYRVTPHIIGDHLLLGVGANQYSLVAPRYGLVDPYTGYTFDHAHDIALTIGAELGLVGLAGLAWLVARLALVLWRAVVRAPVDRALAVAVTAALVGLSLQGLVDYTVRSNIIAALVAVLAGCGVALSRPPPAGSAPPSPPR
jgi:O-antigen ligase